MNKPLELLIENWGLPSENGDVQSLIETKIVGDGQLYIEGVFLQADVVNRNGRRYPKHVLKGAVDAYIKEQVVTSQALGELNHPTRSNVDPDMAAIRITELWWEGSNVMGKAIVLSTKKGKQVKALIEGGWIPGVSSRGLGSTKLIGGINEVTDFRLTVGVDVVWGPSAPSAYVKAVTESEKMSESTSNISEIATLSSDNRDFANLAEKLETLL